MKFIETHFHIYNYEDKDIIENCKGSKKNIIKNVIKKNNKQTKKTYK